MGVQELCTVNVSDQMMRLHTWMHMQLFVYGAQKWELNTSCSISPSHGYFSMLGLTLGTKLQSRCTPQCIPHHPCQHLFGKVDFEQEKACRNHSCKHLGAWDQGWSSHIGKVQSGCAPGSRSWEVPGSHILEMLFVVISVLNLHHSVSTYVIPRNVTVNFHWVCESL